MNGKDDTYTILIVEDDTGLNRLIQRTLERAGFRTRQALNGAEAISIIGKESNLVPDSNRGIVVLLDYRLPDMTGKEVIETITKQKQGLSLAPIEDVPFIIMTGHGDEKVAVEMMKLGVRDYLTKEANFLDLLPQVVTKVLEKVTTEKRLAETREALRKSEERYRLLFNSGNDMIFVWEMTDEGTPGKLIEVNDEACQKLGYPKKELLDFSPRNIVASEGVEELSALAERFLAKKRIIFETVGITKDRVKIPLEISAHIFDLGEKSAVLAIARDITERKQVEEELRTHREHLEGLVAERTAELTIINEQLLKEISDRKQAEEEITKHAALLEAANKELESFSYSVSHDLRAPLRAIDSFSQILLEDYANTLDAEGQRMLNMISHSAKTMGQLVDGLLTFIRLGRRELKRSEIDMQALAKDVCEEFELLIPNRQLHIRIGQLPPAYGDRAMLRQVFVNLLSNAIKFTEPREIATIEVEGGEEKQKQLYSIKDNGVGFDMTYANKLFGVFQRLHGVEEFEGTGVGLALVQRIIHRHGGRVWAEGEVHKGATFYFTLPVVKE